MGYMRRAAISQNLGSRNPYRDIRFHSRKLLKIKDNKFSRFTEIFLDNGCRGGIRLFQSFDELRIRRNDSPFSFMPTVEVGLFYTPDYFRA